MKLCGETVIHIFRIMCLLLVALNYAIILFSICYNISILGENAENWKHCTGGNFLHNITVFALITDIIGFISANSLNVIMSILYYAMGYSAIQKKSGNCQITDPKKYESVLLSQILMITLLWMSIPSFIMFIACEIPSETCCEGRIDNEV
ncbi:unnamed protein product [Rhizophagus irregularis]|uniref:Uncharacterized protein n=1 Tax=Rhizophagus irregularis TaxID=588596 RepID=A0A2N1MD24_9GLOM|nr:hypothetical protein RhiirC2_794720 [Rhizophagus irregularis]CAB5385296.1 unnamed protein product [Rhizophagus irregularis]